MVMTEEERDDVLLGIYIQMSRIYDILLSSSPHRTAIELKHSQGQLIGPEPSLIPAEDEENA
jgi:hypothetical protein